MARPQRLILLYQNPGSNALEAATKAKAKDGGTGRAFSPGYESRR